MLEPGKVIESTQVTDVGTESSHGFPGFQGPRVPASPLRTIPRAPGSCYAADRPAPPLLPLLPSQEGPPFPPVLRAGPSSPELSASQLGERFQRCLTQITASSKRKERGEEMEANVTILKRPLSAW